MAETPRTQRMCRTPIEVINADEAADTIRIVVVGWQIDEEITVPLRQFALETGLDAAGLVAAQWLEAEVNVDAFGFRELRFRNIAVAPPLPVGFMGTTGAPAVTDTSDTAAERVNDYLCARAEHSGNKPNIAHTADRHGRDGRTLTVADLRAVLDANREMREAAPRGQWQWGVRFTTTDGRQTNHECTDEADARDLLAYNQKQVGRTNVQRCALVRRLVGDWQDADADGAAPQHAPNVHAPDQQ